MNRNLLIAIIVIIIIAIVGAFVLTNNGNGGKLNTQITISDQATFKNGDQVQFELKDQNDNVISGEQVNITYAGDENQTFTVVTDTNGRGYLLIENQPAGKYVVVVKYAGSDKYNGFEAQKSIVIEEGTSDSASSTDSSSDSAASTSTQQQSENQTSTGSQSSSSSNLNYDSELNVYYDNDGIIRGGQNDGESYDYIKNNPPQVVDGNLE